MDKQPRHAATVGADFSGVWLPEIVANIAQFLPSNEVVCTLRLVDKAAASVLHGHCRMVRMSAPAPEHAFASHWSAPAAYQSLTLSQRCQLICWCAGTGSLSNLSVAVAAAGVLPAGSEAFAPVAAAAAGGKLDACSWLLERGYGVNWKALEAAAGANERLACLLLYNRGAKLTHLAVLAAARAGWVTCAKWLLSELRSKEPNSSFLSPSILQGLAESCSLEALQHHWAEYGYDINIDKRPAIVAAAAGSSTPDWQAKVAWLMEGVTKPRRSWGYAAAALPDGAARLQWLASTHGYQPNAECLLRALAAPGGSVETVRWLLSEEVEGRTSGGLSKIAACAGLEKLRLLHEGGRLRHPGAALLYALRAGDAHAASAAWLLELCRSHPDGQFELTARHLASAARSGSVRLLAWLREEGCPMGAWAWDRLDRAVETRQRVGVVASGCEAALEWLAEAGCPMPTNGMPYVTAACSGDMRTLEVLRRVGMPLGPQNGIAFKAAIGGRAREAAAPLPVLQWLVEAGMPVRWDKASEESRLYRSGPEREEVRAWLKEQRAAARQRGEAVSMKEEAEEEEYKKCEFGFLCRRVYEEKGWEDEFDSDMGDVDDKHWDDDVDESDDGDGDDDEEGGQGAPEGDAQEQA